jgi:hypothetical protein
MTVLGGCAAASAYDGDDSGQARIPREGDNGQDEGGWDCGNCPDPDWGDKPPDTFWAPEDDPGNGQDNGGGGEDDGGDYGGGGYDDGGDDGGDSGDDGYSEDDDDW